MGKDYHFSVLLDYYKDLLTGKQAEALFLYYDQDLSLFEISEHLKISRQGVRDCIKRGERQLVDFEENFGLYEKNERALHIIEAVNEHLQIILSYEKETNVDSEVQASCRKIAELVNCLAE